MSKLIRITQNEIDECKEEFSQMLSTMKMDAGEIYYKKKFGALTDKAKLIFTGEAWAKMRALVDSFDKEIAWHGIAERGEVKGEYIVKDILVYPQETTAATVTTDQVKYQTWLYEFDDDTFSKIRFQGHSHVNMGTAPSGVDTDQYTSILSMLGDGDFYIFLITNKKCEKWVKIYDMTDNIMYETSDITVSVIDDNDVLKFIKEADKLVTKYVPPVTAKLPETSKYYSKSAASEYYSKFYDDENEYYSKAFGTKKYSYGGYYYDD